MDSKDYVDADMGNPIVIGNCNSGFGGKLYECIPEYAAKNLKLDYKMCVTDGYVWVKKLALDLAKEEIKRKESIEPRLERAKND